MKVVFWGGIILFVGSIFLLANNYENIKVQREGRVVKMRIEELPVSCIGTKVKHFVTLSYNSNRYTKKIGSKYCGDHNVGELVDIKFLEGYSLVLFPDESTTLSLISFGFLGLVGLFITLSQLKKIRR